MVGSCGWDERGNRTIVQLNDSLLHIHAGDEAFGRCGGQMMCQTGSIQHMDAVGLTEELPAGEYIRVQDSTKLHQPVILTDWTGFTIFEWIMFSNIYIRWRMQSIT